MAIGSELLPTAPFLVIHRAQGAACPSCRGLSEFCRICKRNKRADWTSEAGTASTAASLLSADSRLSPGDSSLRLAQSAPVVNPAEASLPIGPPPAPLPEPAAVPPEISASSSLPVKERQRKRDRQQIKDWGEQLYQEVANLQKERLQLKCLLTTAQESLSKQESELERTRQKCAELERLMRESVAQNFHAASAVSENEDLRRQLSAYAVEIDELRKEVFASMSQPIGEDAVEEPLADILPGHSGTTAKAVEVEVEVETASPEELKGIIHILWRALNELQENFVAQTQEFARLTMQLRKCQREAEAEGEIARKQVQDHVQIGLDIKQHITQSRALYDDLQKVKDDNTRLKQSMEELTLQNSRLQVDMLTTNEWATSLEEKLRTEKNDHDDCRRRLDRIPVPLVDKYQRERSRGKTDQQALLEACLHRDIAWEMQVARTGVSLEKVQDHHQLKRETRTLVLCPDEMHLKWHKPSSKKPTILNLSDVIRIEFSHMNRISATHRNIWPWLCFSLYTVHRSYDFCCPEHPDDLHGEIKDKKLKCTRGHELKRIQSDTCVCSLCHMHKVSDWELCSKDIWRCDACNYSLCRRCASMTPEDVVQCFVLAISRLIPHAAGAVPSRHTFLATKGWCKVKRRMIWPIASVTQIVKSIPLSLFLCRSRL